MRKASGQSPTTTLPSRKHDTTEFVGIFVGIFGKKNQNT
jgi:hypothetical protein